MKRILVVGSGASGVHFALSLLRKGHAVTLVDAGRNHRQQVMSGADFDAVRERLPDPAAHFLGENFDGVLLPDADQEYYGIPPHKQYIFEPPPSFRHSSRGFSPLFSFARGGLAEAWTGGCYPFNQAELTAFPFGYAELAPHYDEIARRIGVTGEADDLARFMPVHQHLLEPLRFDRHSQLLLDTYQRRRDWFNRQLGCHVGRTRVATLSRAMSGRKPCSYLGRCLWGCPEEALYTPSQTLRECQQHPAFTYEPGWEVQYFRYGPDQRVTALVATPLDGGPEREFPVEHLALAAGALCSSKILLHSVYQETGRIIRLPGLMDNRQLLVPFLNLRMLGRIFRADSYQYHLLGMGFETSDPAEYIHCQITTLKTALMHPIIQQLPLDLRTAAALARVTHAALGVVNVNLHDRRRPDNHVTLAPSSDDPRRLQLQIQYAPAKDEAELIRLALRRVGRALRALGCIVPPGMTHVRPMGASVHYCGTLPMSREAAPWTTNANGRSHDFANLHIVDGATFPFLPAKNLTFTLMANAARIAAADF